MAGQAVSIARISSSLIACVAALVTATGLGHAGPGIGPTIKTSQTAEVQRVIADMAGVLQSVRESGAEVEFLLWTSRGAVTMVSHARVAPGGVRRAVLSRSDIEAAMDASALQTYVGLHDRYLTLRIRRARDRWDWIRTDAHAPKQNSAYPAHPDGGRSAPVYETGITAAAQRGVAQMVDRLHGFLRVPARGGASMRAAVVFDDDRVLSWSPEAYRANGARGAKQNALADPSAKQVVTAALLPFAHGLGRRTIVLELRGTHVRGERHARWTVTRAQIRRPPASADIAQEITRAYRHTHEQVIVQWRRGVRDAAIMAAGFTMEQVALWVVGGWLFKAVGAAFRPLAPKLMRVLRWFGTSRKKAASEYMETLLLRLPGRDKEAVRALMAKAETQGMGGLSAAERSELQSMLKRLESMLSAPLNDAEKRLLRHASQSRFAAAQSAVLKAFDHAGMRKEIHHRIPLEWAHRVPGLDINSAKNLFAMNRLVHRAASAVWTRFRTAPAARVTEAHVQQVARIIDRHFRHWYNKPPALSGLKAATTTAKNNARVEVDTLVAALRAGT